MLFYERKLLQYWKVFFRVQKISFHEILLLYLFFYYWQIRTIWVQRFVFLKFTLVQFWLKSKVHFTNHLPFLEKPIQ